MLRLLIVVVLAIAAVWYFARETGEQKKIFADQRDVLEDAKSVTRTAEELSAAMATQADAIRDSVRESGAETEREE